jgi:ABC-2 type transport system ATP-binding protein
MISIQHIYKRYRSVHALEDLSLEIPQGAIFGLIGPNGAGKTTLLRILGALIPPTTGQVWFGNEEVTQSPTTVQRKVGYMPDFFGVYPDLTSEEYLEFYAGIHGISRRKRSSVVSDLLELVDLTSKRDALVETLSRGMQQRMCLARALIHDPDVLLLDEPASGLDPRARVEFRELLRTLQGMGKTVVISSHILLELAEMCSDIAIIRAGQLVMAGNVEQVTHSLGGGNQIEVRVLERATDAKQLLKEMAEISNLLNENEDGEVIQAEFSGDNQALHRILAELMAHDIPVVSFAPRRAVDRLEEVYMSITEGASAI